MTLRDYLRILRERWKLIVVFTTLATALAIAVTSLTPKEYQASVQVYVATNASADATEQWQAAAFIQSQVATYADIVDSPDILHRIKQDLNLQLPDQELAAKISATAPTQRSLVDITASDGNADFAAQLANSAASAFIATLENYSQPEGNKAPTLRMYVTSHANAPSTPVSPRPVLNIAVGVFLGLLVGIALAVARELLDNRIKSPDELATIAQAPLMGVVIEDPKTSRHPIATRAGTRSVRAENYRQLRANLQFANVDQHPRVIAVTSSVPSEGKTTVAINLASTLAEAGFTVCLVDADLRRPMVAKTLGLLSPIGLTSVLIHQIDLTDAIQHAGSSLYVLTSGPTPPNPSEVLASSFVRGLIRSLLDRVDYVVLDTAPLLPVSDGSEVAALADGALVVARYGETTEPQVRRAAQSLRRVDATLLGVILNRMPIRRSKGEYGYGYYRVEAEKPGHSQRETEKAPRRADRTGART